MHTVKCHRSAGSARKRPRMEITTSIDALSLASQPTPPPSLIYTASPHSLSRQESITDYQLASPSMLPSLPPTLYRIGNIGVGTKGTDVGSFMISYENEELHTQQYFAYDVNHMVIPSLPTRQTGESEWVAGTNLGMHSAINNHQYPKLQKQKHDTYLYDDRQSYCSTQSTHKFDDGISYCSTNSTDVRNHGFAHSSCSDLSFTTTFDDSEENRDANQSPQEFFDEHAEEDGTSSSASLHHAPSVDEGENFFRILEYNTSIATSNADLMKNIVEGIQNHQKTFPDEDCPDGLYDRLHLSKFVDLPPIQPHACSAHSDKTSSPIDVSTAVFKQKALITEAIDQSTSRDKRIVSDHLVQSRKHALLDQSCNNVDESDTCLSPKLNSFRCHQPSCRYVETQHKKPVIARFLKVGFLTIILILASFCCYHYRNTLNCTISRDWNKSEEAISSYKNNHAIASSERNQCICLRAMLQSSESMSPILLISAAVFQCDAMKCINVSYVQNYLHE